ncbi:hypothetical protein Tco_1483522, partial [Tanacetum coccineum]
GIRRSGSVELWYRRVVGAVVVSSCGGYGGERWWWVRGGGELWIFIDFSNCKHLLEKITVLEATVEMYMHPEQHTLNSAALLHEVYNDMGKLDLE